MTSERDFRICTTLAQSGIKFDLEAFEGEALDEQRRECDRYTKLLSDELGVPADLNNKHKLWCSFWDKYQYRIKSFAGDWLEANQYDNQAMYYLSWAMYHKSNLSRYSLDKFNDALGDDGRIHPNWQRHNDTTGRLVCSKPALQGLPSEYRKYFIPEDGNVFVTADFKTIDLRCLARLTDDKKLIENLGADHDIHAETASTILSLPVDAITKEQRQLGKHVNFAVVYGCTKYGLSKMLSIETDNEVTEDDAQRYISAFLMKYPKVQHYRWQLQHKRITPTSVGGKTFDVSGNKALNYPVQASTAEGLMKTLDVILKTKDDDMKLVMTIHDSITLEVPASKELQAQEFLKSTAEAVMGDFLSPVPVFAEIKYNF